jgi:hypothetical protein
MIRFAWLQARTQTATAVGVLLVLAAALLVTGPHLAHLYTTTIAGCSAHNDCAAVRTAYLSHDNGVRTWLNVLVGALPALLGMFWGAPLVARELEAGTFRLVWTQSVTRTRWLVVQLGIGVLASMVVIGLLSLMVSWWAHPLDRAHLDAFNTFDQRDLVPVGYAAFALTLGVTFGILIRRTVPAMAATLVVFVAARMTESRWIRPHLITPHHHVSAITSASVIGSGSSITSVTSLFSFAFSGGGRNTLQLQPPNLPNAWIYSTHVVDNTGHSITSRYLASACPSLGGGGSGGAASGPHTSHASASAQRALHECGTTIGARFHEVLTYQPADRYWDFQWLELALYLGVAVILAGGCLWWLRHRFT